jgi:surface antigen
LIGVGGVNRKMVFGTACQLPDGQWIEKRWIKKELYF